MAKLDGVAVAKLLAEYGRRSALRGGNPYRARAYRQAAENILALTKPLETLIAEGRVREIPGVGNAIADIVTTLHNTGTHPTLERMREEVPEGVLEMLAIPGLRPDKALKLYKEVGIASVDELEKAARQDRLKSVKGLGPALQAKILQGIDIHRRSEGQRHIHRAAELLKAAETNLKKSKLGYKHVQPAGDFRSLLAKGQPVNWRAVAKDGADLPPLQATAKEARQVVGVGETYDFEFRPTEKGDLRLEVLRPFNRSWAIEEVQVR